MQVTDLLSRPGSRLLDGTNPGERVESLLPGSGISIGPPTAEDVVEISPLAHALVRINQGLEAAEAERVNGLRLRYLRGAAEPDPEQLARSLLDDLAASAETSALR